MRAQLALAACLFTAVALADGSSTAPPNSVTIGNTPATMDIEMAAARGQREFVASTNLQALAANSYLNITICNAAGSGKLVSLTERRFDSDLVTGQIPVKYGGIANPLVPSGTGLITSTGSNLYTGGAASSAVTVSAIVSTTRLNNAAGNAVPTATGAIPSGGEPLKLLKPRLIPPGTCQGNYIVGMNQPSGLGNVAVNAGLTVYWTEE